MEDPRHLLDPLVEQAERGRVREHEARRALVDLSAEVIEVEVPARIGLDAFELIARHRHARRIRAVRRVRGDDRVALLAAIGEVRAHEHEPGQLSLRACRRLQRHGREARDLGEDPLQVPHELERALRVLVVGVRMQVAEAGKRCEPLVHARVVLHRAGAERIEAGVDAERAIGERREVADDLRLGELGQPGRARAAQRVGNLRHREVRPRRPAGATAGARPLEDQRRLAPGASRFDAHVQTSREHVRETVDVLDRLLLGHGDEQHVVHALVVATERVAGVDPVLARAADDLASRQRSPERDLLERPCVERR